MNVMNKTEIQQLRRRWSAELVGVIAPTLYGDSEDWDVVRTNCDEILIAGRSYSDLRGFPISRPVRNAVGVDLSYSTLAALCSISHCNASHSLFRHLSLAPIVSGAVEHCDFSQTTFKKCQWMPQSRFTGCSFDRCDFRACVVDSCVFQECTFVRATVKKTEFIECEFIECEFTDIVIADSSIGRCVFRNTRNRVRYFDMNEMKHFLFQPEGNVALVDFGETMMAQNQFL